jgi:hypothetical protein
MGATATDKSDEEEYSADDVLGMVSIAEEAAVAAAATVSNSTTLDSYDHDAFEMGHTDDYTQSQSTIEEESGVNFLGIRELKGMEKIEAVPDAPSKPISQIPDVKKTNPVKPKAVPLYKRKTHRSGRRKG